MVTNHHTMLLGKYFLTSHRITVLSRSSSRRIDVQEDGIYYKGTQRPHLVHVTTTIVGLPPLSLTPL